MGYEVRIERGGAVVRTAVVRRHAAGAAELARIVPEACGVVWGVIRAQRVQGAGRNLALYLDDSIRLEVGVEMAGAFAGAGEVVSSELPAGAVATAAHFGPYGGLGAAHRAVRDWAAGHGHALAGPCWEVYGHWLEAWNSAPSLVRTDVYYLLAAGGGAGG